MLVVMALAQVTLGGCYAWTPVSVGGLRSGQEEVRLHRVRITSASRVTELEVHRVRLPYIEGWDEEARRERRVDVVHVDRIEVRSIDRGASSVAVFFGSILGGLAAAALGVLVLIAANPLR
ncbi:MAG: hypothetical protein KA978_00190 [Deltaproteobacteria bacterium]|nr:hypothetical protein [Deltaproteobacteria bacterium]MBP6829164.1 hypothetical protein [Deltaproteobacteria bacterium]